MARRGLAASRRATRDLAIRYDDRVIARKRHVPCFAAGSLWQRAGLREDTGGDANTVRSGNAMTTGGRAEEHSRSLRLPFASLFFAAFLWLITCPSGFGAEGTKRVVVLYPVSDGQPGIILFDQRLRSVLQSSSSGAIEIYNEYLDAARFAGEPYQRQLAVFLRRKYADRKVDVVIPAL